MADGPAPGRRPARPRRRGRRRAGPGPTACASSRCGCRSAWWRSSTRTGPTSPATPPACASSRATPPSCGARRAPSTPTSPSPAVLREGLAKAGLPADALVLVEDTSHEAAVEFMQLRELDRLPDPPRRPVADRGRSSSNATVPYVIDGDGNCHVYVDAAADLDMALDDRRQRQDPAAVGVQRGRVAAGPRARRRRLPAARRRPRSTASSWWATSAAAPSSPPIVGAPPTTTAPPSSSTSSWPSPWCDSLDDAIDHVNRYGSGHTEAIVTTDLDAADRFTREVDAAAVLVNASTRFVDGEEFGFGAEIGISTQKLHARGPMGLRELTTTSTSSTGTARSAEAGSDDRRRPRSWQRAIASSPCLRSVRALRKRRLPGRRGHRRRRVPRRPAAEADPGRGAGRHGQDPAGQVGRRDDRRPPDPPAVLRGPRRVQGPLRVELQEAAAAHPGRARRRRQAVERDRGRHLLRGVPAHPAAARGHPRRASRSCCSSTRSTASRSRPRPCCSRSSPTTRCRSPSSAPSSANADPAGVPHLEQHP